MLTSRNERGRSIQRGAHWVLTGAFVLAIVVFAGAPIAAIGWARRPFPGFVVESTAVVADYGGTGWGTSPEGLHHPQRVTQIRSQVIDGLPAFQAATAGLLGGADISVTTRTPERETEHHTLTVLPRFPPRDLIRLFWLPYGVGLAYLALGLWVHMALQQSTTEHAFALFSVATALILGLFFDLISTHVAPALWTIAIALEGGALMGLALRFARSPAERWALGWPDAIPYILSGSLAVWGIVALRSPGNPWAYVVAWRVSYVYAAAGIIGLIVVVAAAALSDEAPDAEASILRRQARAILAGSVVAFGPIAVWLAAPAFGIQLPFVTALFVPPLIAFPLSIALAIRRYRLWDLDVIVNRTLVYAALSALLGAVYVTGILLVELLLERRIGPPSSLAVALSTLGIAALFQPLRRRVQHFIDRRFYRQKYDAAQTLIAFGATLRGETDLTQLAEQISACIQETLQPAHVCLWLASSAGFEVAALNGTPARRRELGADVHASPVDPRDPLVDLLLNVGEPVAAARLTPPSAALQALRDEGTRLIVPLISQSELVGWVGLGARRSDQPYAVDDRALLRDLANRAAPAIRVAQLVLQRQQEAVEQDRLQREMAFAHVVQRTLLPAEVPHPDGWEVAVYWEPARAVGGDFYDVLALDGDGLAVTVADVTDKGIPAALVMASTRPILRGAARRARPPAEALARANELLQPELLPGMFVTCLYALLDGASGRLRYANAGHNPPYLRRRSGACELWATGMALGLLPDVSYEEHEATIEPGDSLLFYSDGLLEAHNAAGEMYGLERIQTALERSDGGAQALIDRILADLHAFTGHRPELEDDITLVALHRCDPKGEGDG